MEDSSSATRKNTQSLNFIAAPHVKRQLSFQTRVLFHLIPQLNRTVDRSPPSHYSLYAFLQLSSSSPKHKPTVTPLTIQGIDQTLALSQLKRALALLQNSGLTFSGTSLTLFPRLLGGRPGKEIQGENKIEKSHALPITMRHALSELESDLKEKWTEICNNDLPHQIPARATHRGSTQTFDLPEEIDVFLENDDQSLYLIQGDSGSGKSVFALWLAHRLWESFWKNSSEDQAEDQKTVSYIPVYLPLSAIYPLTPGFLDHSLSRCELKDRTQPYLFILDGYDEVSFEGTFYNLIESRQWPRSKFIVTCRTHFLRENYRQQFVEKGPLPQAYLAPLTQGEVKEYFKFAFKKVAKNKVKGAKKKKASETPTDFHKTLQSMPQLAKLAETPYLARQLATIHSTLSQKLNSHYRLSRAKLYELFTQSHFEQEMERLHRNHIDLGGNTIESFLNYSQGLAIEMFKRGVTSVDPNNDLDINPAKEAEEATYPDKTHNLNLQPNEGNPWKHYFDNPDITVYVWNVSRVDHPTPQWRVPPHLYCKGLQIEGAKGLSKMTTDLLSQWGNA